jgi:predicted membrane protein
MILAWIYLPILAAISWFYRDHERSTIIHSINLIFFLIPLAFNDEGAIFALEFGSIWIAWGMSWNVKHGRTFFIAGVIVCFIAIAFLIYLSVMESRGSRYSFITISGLIAIGVFPAFGLFSVLFRIGEYLGPKKEPSD